MSRWRVGYALIIVGLSMILLLVACHPRSEVMRIGTNVWLGYEPLYLARDLGLYEGQRIHLVEYSNASQVMSAFRDGVIEAAALTLDEALLLLQDGFSPRIFLVLDVSHGADVIIGQTSINKLSELSGMRVGVENSALGAYILERALDRAGLTPSQITLIPMTVDQHEKAFREEAVDAVVTFEPVRSRLLDEGASLLFDSRDIFGEIVDVLVVDADFARKNPDKLRLLQQDWFVALDYLQSSPDNAARYMSKRLKMAPEQILAAYSYLKFPSQSESKAMLGQGGGEATLRGPAQRLAATMYRGKLLTQKVDIMPLFDWQQEGE